MDVGRTIKILIFYYSIQKHEGNFFGLKYNKNVKL